MLVALLDDELGAEAPLELDCGRLLPEGSLIEFVLSVFVLRVLVLPYERSLCIEVSRLAPDGSFISRSPR